MNLASGTKETPLCKIRSKSEKLVDYIVKLSLPFPVKYLAVVKNRTDQTFKNAFDLAEVFSSVVLSL